jgi:hypothetical protein
MKRVWEELSLFMAQGWEKKQTIIIPQYEIVRKVGQKMISGCTLSSRP